MTGGEDLPPGVEDSGDLAAYEVYVSRYLDQREAAGTDPLDPAAVDEFTAWVEREDPDAARAVRREVITDAIDRACREAADRGLGTYDGRVWTDAPGREAEARMYLNQRWGELLAGEDDDPEDDGTSQRDE